MSGSRPPHSESVEEGINWASESTVGQGDKAEDGNWLLWKKLSEEFETVLRRFNWGSSSSEKLDWSGRSGPWKYKS